MAIVTSMRARDPQQAEATWAGYLRERPKRQHLQATTDVAAALGAYLVMMVEASDEAAEAFTRVVLKASLRSP